jgi:hypothetical protein
VKLSKSEGESSELDSPCSRFALIAGEGARGPSKELEGSI